MSAYDKYMKGNRKNDQKNGKNKAGSAVPKDTSQWAADAYKALEKALIAFEEDYPNPDEDERLELIGYAAELAAEARGITDPNRIDEADEYAVDNVLADLEAEESDEQQDDFEGSDDTEEPQYPILFLLCYLDAHVSFGLLKENRLEAIMDHLAENYELIIS